MRIAVLGLGFMGSSHLRALKQTAQARFEAQAGLGYKSGLGAEDPRHRPANSQGVKQIDYFGHYGIWQNDAET